LTIRRTAQRQPQQRGVQVSKPINWIAPTGGFRSDKPLEALPPDAASTLVNFFPEPGYLRPRNGSNNFATGLSGPVQTLMAYFGAGNDRMFAVAGANIYDVTSPVTNPTPIFTAVTNPNMSFTTFTTSASTWLIACNGVDPVIEFNGSAWVNAAITGNTNPLLAVANYQSRLYFLESGTGMLWFMPTLGITGALAGSLNIGALFEFGGLPIDIAVWTAATVSGPVLMLCIISTEGEVIVFTGSDPTSSSSFSKLASFKMGFPLGSGGTNVGGGNKCFFPMGGDLAIMTVDGVVPISKAITLDPSATDSSALTGPIAPTFLAAVQTVGRAALGWQLMVYPSRRMCIVNVPDPVQGTYQFVMNTETQAWTQFTGMPATVWLSWEQGLYFGTSDGRVVQADIGANDIGAPIDCFCVGGWQRLSDGFAPKLATLISIDAIVDNTVALFAGASFNFNPMTPQSVGGGQGVSTAGEWDESLWDVGIWGGTQGVHLVFDANGSGVIFAPTFRALINGTTGQFSGLQITGGSLMVQQGGGI
jgi:hypothetical protein